MDLKTFVAEALSDVILGVKEAQQRIKESGGSVNPELIGPVAPELMKNRLFLSAGGGVAQMVEFDVAVTATESVGSKGGIGVVVAALTLGTSAQQQSDHAATSRIKFVVPVRLPRG